MNVFDLTLVWPFRLSKDGLKSDLPELAAQALEANGWSLIRDPLLRDGKPEHDGYAAAELAFFHPFIQRLLYGERTPRERPFQLYRYAGFAQDATLMVDKEAWHDVFRILSLSLYLMDDCSAIMVLHLTSPQPTCWDNVRNAISYLRTVHYQHYEPSEDGKWIGGGAPERVIIGHFGSSDREMDRQGELKAVVKSKKPALLDHWKELLKPLTDKGIDVSAIGDYRMAVMAFIGTPEPESLSEDDWFALAEADAAGFKTYAPPFRDSRLKKSTYDRWWTKNAKGEFRDRWVAGPLTLARVLAVSSPDPPAWVERVRSSWWRQYFLIFFLAHFQRAALMILQTRIAAATRFTSTALTWDGLWRLRSELEGIERDMALFSSRFWFTEASPQVQGQDLFTLLRQKIGSDALYRGVIEDKALLAEWARTRYWEVLNGWVIPLGLYFTAASVVANPIAKWMGWMTYRAVPVTGAMLTQDLRESITVFVTVMVLGALLLMLWQFKRRAKS